MSKSAKHYKAKDDKKIQPPANLTMTYQLGGKKKSQLRNKPK